MIRQAVDRARARADPSETSGIMALWRAGRLTSLLVGGVLGAGTFAYLRAFPPSLNLADESFVLYSAKRLLAGEVLYRDVFEFITPLSFWYFALAYRLGGTTIQAAKVAMAAANALSAVLIYGLARKVAGVIESAVAVLVFAGVCLPAWRMASPHWLSTTLCLATAVALLGDRWQGSQRTRPLIAGMLGGVAFCNQQHQGAVLALWLAAGTAVLVWTADGSAWVRRFLRELIALAAGWLAVVVPVLAYCVWRASWQDVYAALVVFVLGPYRRTFVGKLGWAQPFFVFELAYTWLWLLRAVPGILAVEVVALGGRLRFHRRRMEAVRAALLLLAAAMAASVLYFPDFVHVAFIAPFTLIVAAGLVHRLRGSERFGPLVRAVACAATVAVGVAAVVKAREAVARDWAGAPVLRETAFGTVAMPSMFAESFDRIRRVVNAVPPERRTLFVFPVDAWLYLTLPARNPTPFELLTPGVYSPAQFATVERILAAGGAEFVVLNEWARASVMPQDPFQAVLQRDYRVVPEPDFVYVIYRRR